MVDWTSYSTIVTIAYGSIYFLLFVITSIVAANQLKKQKENNLYTLQTMSQPHDHNIYQNDEYKENKPPQSDESSTSCCSCCSSVKHWFMLVKEKNSVYLSALPHIFDQATDYGVLVEYYELWQNEGEHYGALNTKYLFLASVFVIIFHRLISAGAFYALTRRCGDVVLQLFDILIFRTIFINYQLGRKEPCNPQRYLQILEATFESAPQLLLNLGYILRSSMEQNTVSTIVVVSAVFSLITLTTRVADDDKLLVSKEWKDVDFKCGCPMVNSKWALRVFGWRFLEISTRMCVCCLIWINLGGVAIIVILLFEFVWCLLICVVGRSVYPLQMIMYLSKGVGSNADDVWCNFLMIGFWAYRIGSFVTFMLLVTILSVMRFEAKYIESFEIRNTMTIKNPLGCFMLIYAWVAGIIWPYVATRSIDMRAATDLKSTARDLRKLIVDKNAKDAFELLQFGAVYDLKQSFYYLVQFCVFLEDTSFEDFLIILEKMIASNPKAVKDKDDFENTLIHVAMMFENYAIMKYFIDNNFVDINSKGAEDKTVLHHLHVNKKNSTSASEIAELAQYLLNKGVDTDIVDEKGKTAYAHLSETQAVNDEILQLIHSSKKAEPKHASQPQTTPKYTHLGFSEFQVGKDHPDYVISQQRYMNLAMRKPRFSHLRKILKKKTAENSTNNKE
eukprot:228810_1